MDEFIIVSDDSSVTIVLDKLIKRGGYNESSL